MKRKKKEVPNCAACTWCMEEKRIGGFAGAFVVAVCKAQAYEDASKVYNNKLCKNLFEDKTQQVRVREFKDLPKAEQEAIKKSFEKAIKG